MAGALHQVHIALTIAGSDSGGGAGIQADLKTFAALGIFGTSAITAVTAQNPAGVSAIQGIEAAVVKGQIRAVLDWFPVGAVKVGMLLSREIVEAVAEALGQGRSAEAAEAAVGEEMPIVVDPVMVATSGDRLLEETAERAYHDLFRLATLVTPNLHEAEILTGRPIGDLTGMCEAAAALVAEGCGAVLLKGGHLPGVEVLDLLHDGRRWHVWREERIDTTRTHGTGCTLSAAITAGLALGQGLFEAVDRGLRYTREALRSAPELGGSRGPLNHWAHLPEDGY